VCQDMIVGSLERSYEEIRQEYFAGYNKKKPKGKKP